MDRRTFIASTAGAAVTAPAFAAEEAPLMPEIEIIDTHHHLVDNPARENRPASRYGATELLKDIKDSGQRVTATVVVETMTQYRVDGPAELRTLGETEFFSRMADEAAAGPVRIAAGIVAAVDLRLGDKVQPVLDAHMNAAKGRLRGVRVNIAWDEFPVMGIPLDPVRAVLLDDANATAGMRVLAKLGLTLDTWTFHHQIHKVTAAAQRVPGLTVILDHIGSPIGGVGPYAGKEKEVFKDWETAIRAAAKAPNLVVKLGGLGMQFISPQFFKRTPAPASEELAKAWAPYFEVCIAAFGANRCMFESNFPPDAATAPYGTMWNAFKRVTAKASEGERIALFSGTAKRVYRL
jgi:predicted TIM-barrel fold metal-dependent hydrolase